MYLDLGLGISKAASNSWHNVWESQLHLSRGSLGQSTQLLEGSNLGLPFLLLTHGVKQHGQHQAHSICIHVGQHSCGCLSSSSGNCLGLQTETLLSVKAVDKVQYARTQLWALVKCIL